MLLGHSTLTLQTSWIEIKAVRAAPSILRKGHPKAALSPTSGRRSMKSGSAPFAFHTESRVNS